MQEPLGLLVGMIAERFGIADVSLQLIICALGATALGVGFHLQNERYAPYSSAFGWTAMGLFLYLQSPHYVEISDPVLILIPDSDDRRSTACGNSHGNLGDTQLGRGP